MTRDEIVAAARRCVGVRFRRQGRDPRWGLDCVGVAAIAFGRTVPDSDASGLRDVTRIAAAITASGLRPIDAAQADAGDLLLIEAGPIQPHLAVLTPDGFVHADAGLRRVVEAPGEPIGRVLGVWTDGAAMESN